MPRPRKALLSPSAKVSPDEEEEEKVAPPSGSPSPPLKRQKTTYASPDVSPAPKAMEGSPSRVSTRSSSSSSQTSVKSGRASGKRSLQKQGRQEDDDIVLEPPTSDAPHVATPMPPGDGEDVEEAGKRNRSLEALFRVTDSELASMSKQGTRKVAPEVKKSPQGKSVTVLTGSASGETVSQTLSGNEVTLRVNTKSSASPQSVRIVRVSQISSGGGMTPSPSMSILPVTPGGSSGTPSSIVMSSVPSTPVATPSGSGSGVKLDTPVSISLPNLSNLVTLPGHTVITLPAKSQMTASQNLARALSEEVPRHLVLDDGTTTYTTSQSFDVEGHPKLSHPKKAISLDASSPVMLPIGDLTSPGRRPKMMSRPGKYPCPFCHRTCAKPSVLEKHIRAHTNERPFPCEVCNIAFKTKSNLFKHKKSRAHLLKANPGAVDQLRMSSGSKDSMEEDMEMEEMDDGNETDVSMETIGSSLHQDSLTSQDSISESVDTPGRQTFYVSGIESTLTVVQTSSGELKLALPQSQSVDSAEKILQTPDAELKAKRERLKKGQGSSLPNLPVQHSLSLPMQRQLSIGNLAGPKLTVSELANLPEGLKTERINAHINQLISANNDIVSAPKAAPPRPKRVTRILHSKSDSSVSESAIASHNLLASTSFDSFESPATPMVRMGNPHLLQGSSSSLDSPDISQLMSRSLESQSTPNIHSMISKSTPQEIKIQIKLAPPGGSEAGGSSSSGGGIISSPLSFMPTPGTPGVRPGLKTPISISSLTPILSNTIGTPINLNTPIRTPSSVSPLIGQPVVQFPRATVAVPSMTNTGSTPVKDLLAQKKSAGTPMVIIESPEGEKTTPEGKSLDGSGGTLGRQVIYLNQQGSLDIPQHVAEQVEIVSSNVRGKQGIVRSLSVPSSATYAGTPSVAPGNIIFEQYDPHTPPKRGRPKGSRNLARDQPPVPLAPNTAPTTPLTPNFQAGRFPLLPQAPIVAPTTNNPRPTLKLMIPSQGGSPIMQSPIVLSSQSLTLTSGSLTLTPAMTFTPGSSLTPQTAPMFSTLASPVKQDGTPGTPGTPNTPTAHLKKILKGLLLKRSVSMSSGLNTTKEGGSSKTSLLSSPQKYLRSESVDDTAFRQQLGSDSPPPGLSVRRPPLVRQSKSDAGIVPISRSEEKKLESGLEEGEVLMIDSQAEEEEAAKKGPKIPVNEHQEVYLPMGHHTCPLLVNTKPFPKQLAIIPSLLSGKAKLVNWDSKERDGSVDTTDSQHDSATGSQDSSAETPTDTVQGSAEMEEDPKTSSDTPEPMEVEIKATKQSSTESGIDMTSSDIPSPELPEDKAALEHRARMQILLLSHQYPILRNDTHTTFCTVVKPQPAYVAMEGMQISMYSNWRAATYNPNPQGLTSRQLMDLYHSRWYDVAPSLTSSAKINDDKHSTLTHSSYWNYYGDGEKQDEQLVSKKDAKSAADTVMKLLRLEKDPLDVEIESKETPLVQESPPPAVQQTVVVIESDISAEPAVASTTQSIDVAAEPTTATPQPKDSKRILLGIAGGYKTNEDYVYIRGKGRGKYVCELCGIRCKKPSMLKKHIRSHSDFRPYICTYCNLNFKTKGNLTKHMKSKSHHKRCVHLGITPVPTTVDEAQIDNDVLTKQSIFAWSTRIVDVSPGSNDGSIADDDEDDDDDDNDNDNDEQIEEEEVETTMVIEDGTVIEVETSKDIESEEREVPGELIQIQDEVTGEVQLLYMDAQPEVTVEQEETEEGQVTKIVLTSPDGKQGDGGRPSMDKELAAHTLLDLSKQTDPQPDDSSSEKDAPMEDKDASPGDKRRKLPRQQCISDDDTSQDRGDQRLDSLIGQLKTRTQAPEKPTPITETGAALLTKVGHSAAVSSTRMAATIFQSSSPSKPTSDVTPKTSSPSSPPALTRSDSIPGRKGGTTYAQKIAALQSKNELDLKLGIGDGATKGAGFVPPVFGIETRVEEKAVTKPTVTPSSRPRLVKSDSEPTARPVQATLGIHNPRILMRQKSVDIDSRTSEHDKPQTLTLLGHREGGAAHRRRSLSRQASVTDPDEDQPESSEVVTIEIPGPEGGIAKIQVPLHVFKQSSTTHTATVTTPKVQYVTEGNHAPHEIHPIPGKVSDKTGGPYACSECDKVLPNQQLLTLHQKSHLLECAHKCDDCSQSFRSKALLQKHQRTNEHKARVALNQQVASAQGDTSRLFRCTECDVAFYTHGNLAKHLRSHKHIMSLEKVGKLPIGAALQLESTDLKSLDCTDSESALRGLLHFYDPASYPPPGKDDPQSSSKDQSADSEEYMFDNGGYERVASNEKVTVEMKTNTIDLSDISQRRGETHEEDGDDGQGQSVSGHGSRCGICRQNFNSTDALQRHMPSHAELRPYVCQHCDAGFTTYLFLEAHLAKCFKQSQQTYMCGNCKDTFMSISSLQQHQCNAKPVTMGTAASSSSQPNIVTPSSSPQVVQMIPVSADGKVLYLPLIQSSSNKPVQLVRSRSIAAAPSTPEFTSRHPLLLRSASDAGVFMEGTLPTPVPESPSVHTPFIQGTAPQSPLMLRPTPNSPHSPLRYLPRIQSPLVRGSLPISPLALPTTSTPTQIAHVTRNLFRDSSNTSTLGPQGTFKVTSGNLSPLVTAERLTSQGHLTSRSLVSSLQSQGQFQSMHSQVQGHGTSKMTVAPSVSYHSQRSESTSQLQGAVQVVTTMGGYQAADEATKQHLAKLLNTDQDSLGQVQVMELEGDSIHQMSHMAQATGEDGEVVYVIQMNEDQESQGLQFQTTSAGGASLSLAGGEGTIHGVSRLLSDQKDAGEIYEESETQNQGTVLHEHQGFNPMEGGNGTMMDISHAPSQSSGTTLDAKRKEPEDSESIEGQPPRKKRMLDS